MRTSPKRGNSLVSSQVDSIIYTILASSLAIIAAFSVVVFFSQKVGIQKAHAAAGVATTTAVVINYNDNVKTVVLTFDEAVKTTTAATHNFDLSKLHLRNTLAGADLVDLSTNTISETSSSTSVTITLTEAQRATLIVASGVTGGDSGKIVVRLDAGASYSGATDATSVSAIPVAASLITETADTNAPTISSFNTATGRTDQVQFGESLVASFSEAMLTGSVSLTTSPSLSITWAVSWNSANTTVTFSPSGNLPGGTKITATVTDTDLGTNSISGTNNVVAFTTQTGGSGAGQGGASAPSPQVTVTPSVTVAKAAPADPKVVVNDGASSTSNTQVTLTLSASNSPTEMMVSNSSDSSSGIWEPFSASKVWQISSNIGIRTVYVKFRNTAGSSSLASDYIEFVAGQTSSVAPPQVSTPVVTAPVATPNTPAQTPTSNAHPSGSLVLMPDTKTILLIYGGYSYVFRDGGEFLSYGYSFSNVVPANSDDLALPSGVAKLAAPGALVKLKTSPAAYLVGADGSLQPFPSMKVFNAKGFATSKIFTIGTIQGYTIGPAVSQ